MALYASVSLALLLGWALTQNHIAASEPGYLDFDNLPETNFSCEDKVIGGYYADVETGCQMFHVCTIGQKGEVTDIKFLCLNGTVFDQETRVCERIDEVDCSRSESFFGLNLELYGNHPASLGISPEDECEEECNTQTILEDYEDEVIQSSTQAPSSTSTTTATTTTTTTTTTSRPPTTTGRELQALLALHEAFAHNTLNKPPPPRVINNAFAPDKPQEETASLPPRFPSVRPTYKPKPSDYIHGYPRHHFPLTTTLKPPELQTNYHHFESGDAHFTHSFDAEKPYNFQFFRHSSTPSPFTVQIGGNAGPEGRISVVTSTSSSTSVKTSKAAPNGTLIEYPTGYEEYQDAELVEDPFFGDVVKIPQRGKNRRKRDAPEPKDSDRKPNKTEFLMNLLRSIDIVPREREKLVHFFEEAEPEMEQDAKTMKIDTFLSTLENKIEQVDLHAARNDTGDYDVGDIEGVREDLDDKEWTSDSNSTEIRTKRQADGGRRTGGRQSIDTEDFGTGRRRGRQRGGEDVKPVTEYIRDDVTTKEYRRVPPSMERSRVRFDSRRTGARGAAPSGRREPPQRTRGTSRTVTPETIQTTGTVLVETIPLLSTASPETTRPPRTTVPETTRPPRTTVPEATPGAEVGRKRARVPAAGRREASRSRGPPRSATTTTTTTTTSPPEDLREDPNFSCEGKVKGGFYADIASDCRGFFICSQGEINGPLLKSHFWCGATTKFNQRSRTCQADYIVECSISPRYYHLNNDFLVPETEEELRGSFEPAKLR